MPNRSVFAFAAMMALSLCAQAADQLPGLSFSHNDWELVCDNTRTCRAAGYQSDQDELPISVLLTRKAGPNQPVTGQLMIGSYGNDELLSKLPRVLKLSMRINGRKVGQLVIPKDQLTADLTEKQVAALLAALPRDSEIEWVAGENQWRLSDKGAAAVLLKMDEFQGRIGTRGALIRKGPQDEDSVLPPIPVPVVNAAPVAKTLPGDKKLPTGKSKALRDAIRASVKDDECPDMVDRETGEMELSVSRLTDKKLLAAATCWKGAYNIGYGYWVIDDTPPYHPVLVTTSGSDYSEGAISSSQKGRGLGDCWYTEAWTWDGKQFVLTDSSSSGMCKLIAPGGAWSLPRVITDIRR